MNESAERQDILRLMNEYCYRIDAGDKLGFARLFEHGTFELRGDPNGGLSGTQALLDMLENVILYDGKPQTKHVMSNETIEIDPGGETASAQCYIAVYQALPPDFPLQPIFMGHYFDSFEKVGGEWRFKRREISPDLIGDLSRHRSDMA
jgi:hypothetical protein